MNSPKEDLIKEYEECIKIIRSDNFKFCTYEEGRCVTYHIPNEVGVKYMLIYNYDKLIKQLKKMTLDELNQGISLKQKIEETRRIIRMIDEGAKITLTHDNGTFTRLDSQSEVYTIIEDYYVNLLKSYNQQLEEL